MSAHERAEGVEGRGHTPSGDPAGEPTAFRFGWRALLLNFGFWTFFAALTAVNRLSNSFEPAGTRRVLAETSFVFLHSYLWAALTPLIFWLVWRFSVERSNWILRSLLFLAVGLAVAAFMSLVGDLLWVEVLQFPRFGPPDGSPLRILSGPWFLNNLVTYMGILAAGFAWEYFLRYRAREEEAIRLQAHTAQLQAHAAQLQAQLAEARLTVLRTQLNPHFLFNTLNAVSTLVAKDPKGVRRMIARLSELLRYALEGPKEQEIPLREELKILQRYLEILEIRYQGRLQASVTADPEAEEALVPSLILQPLAENAMKHGVSRAGGYGRIEVHAHRSGDALVLNVRDTGPGDEEAAAAEPVLEEIGSGVGLRNTRARLEELYGSEQRFELRPTPEGGMIAEVVLPFHTRADLPSALESARLEEAPHA